MIDHRLRYSFSLDENYILGFERKFYGISYYTISSRNVDVYRIPRFNGAVITLLAITGLTHKQSYRDIFAITIIKTIAAFFIIGVYLVTGLV